MKLVQKLPVALSLIAALALGGCSKEESQMPLPDAERAGKHSGLKEDALVAAQPPFFAITSGSETGFDLPNAWERVFPLPENKWSGLLTGTSSFTAVWGNSDRKWVKPLPAIPTNVSASTALSVISYTGNPAEMNMRSHVFTVIKNLKPGKAYAVTFYVASTVLNEKLGGGQTLPAYAKTAEIKLLPYATGACITTAIDLTGKEAQWVKKTITFTPTKDNAKFSFSALNAQGNQYSYSHIFVDRNSIKELTAFQPVTTQQMGL